jgi:E3 ubiquitin-protein ligase DOA10
MQECRYCLYSEEKGNDLIDPCKCGGSMRYVHEKCLLDWIVNSKKESYYQYEGRMLVHLIKCEICHSELRYIKEYENGVILSLFKTVINLLSNVKKISILLLHFTICIFFLKRIKLVLSYLQSLYRRKFIPKNLMKFFHELAISLSIYIGVQDILRYYLKMYSDNRKMTIRFLKKDTLETFTKSKQISSNNYSWFS